MYFTKLELFLKESRCFPPFLLSGPMTLPSLLCKDPQNRVITIHPISIYIKVQALFGWPRITQKRDMLQRHVIPRSNRLGGAVNLFEQYFEILQPFPGKIKNSNFSEFWRFGGFEHCHQWPGMTGRSASWYMRLQQHYCWRNLVRFDGTTRTFK